MNREEALAWIAEQYPEPEAQILKLLSRETAAQLDPKSGGER